MKSQSEITLSLAGALFLLSGLAHGAGIPDIKTPKVPRNIDTAKLAAAAAAAKAPAPAQSAVAPQTKVPATAALQPKAAAEVREAAINTAKLENLKEQVDLARPEVKSAEVRFAESNFGGATSAVAGSQLDALKGSADGRSRNPLDGTGNQMVTGRNAMVSEDPSGESSLVDDAVNFLSSVVGSVLSGAGTRTPAGAAAGGTAGAAAGAAAGILTSNLGNKEDEAQGIFGIFRQGRTGTSNENAAAMMKEIDGDGTPLPDDMQPASKPVVTGGLLKALFARKNAAAEPTEESSASTGPINTGANGTGRAASLGQPTGELVDRAVMTKMDEAGFKARIGSKINPAR